MRTRNHWSASADGVPSGARGIHHPVETGCPLPPISMGSGETRSCRLPAKVAGDSFARYAFRCCHAASAR